VLYVSYDGAGEPLGRSQVVAYLRRLAEDCEITLISFEKDDLRRAETAELLQAAGIRWRPVRYHKRPPVLSTLWDICVGIRAVNRATAELDPDVVHVRSVVPGAIAMAARRLAGRRRWKLLFDARAFWADERVVAGSWSADGVLYRIAKRVELGCYRGADAVVTLTAASVPQIRSWLGGRRIPVRVIPTCAEVERFGGGSPRPEGPHAVWCGSIGKIYDFALATRFADAAGVPLTVLTRQTDLARAAIGDRAAEIREVAPEAVAGELRPGDIGLCFYAESFANLARAPTRFAEYLAAGMVVAASPGIGDLDAIIREHEVGVTLHDESGAGLSAAAQRILALAADPSSVGRGQAVAQDGYSALDGAGAYRELYDALMGNASMTTIDGAAPRVMAAGRAL
jgi:hypothetical protein